MDENIDTVDEHDEGTRRTFSAGRAPELSETGLGEILAEKGIRPDADDSDGSFGRTLFDDRGSEDGTVTVVFPAHRIADVPIQSLVRIDSKVDGREYIGTVTSGPFCEPDGLPPGSPQLVIAAVHQHDTLPRHHGRLQASILGELSSTGLIPARRRPRPNSRVHLVDDGKVAELLNLDGDVRLGLMNGHDDIEVRIDTRKKSVLPRHTAHIGTTGGGKSTGVGRMVHELQRSGACVFLFDVEGEYTTLNEQNGDRSIAEVLRQRGLAPSGVRDTHVYHLRGMTPANPGHPSLHEFALRFEQISPFAFGEILDLSDAQNNAVMQLYDLAKILLREFEIYPAKGQESSLIEIDEFDRGWPSMRLGDLQYLVSAVIDKLEEEPKVRNSNFAGNWHKVRDRLLRTFSAGSEDDGKKKPAPKFGNPHTWRGIASRLGRLNRLRIFDQGDTLNLDYGKLMKPGRVNVIDLSDVENLEVRNLVIAELLRGILARQEAIYKANEEWDEFLRDRPLMTNVIVEEAHEFMSAKRIQKMPALRDQLMTIAKRGRKRYLGLTFVTQSPNDLPDDILGLVNNWIVYKVDEATIRRLKSYIPGADDSLWGLVRNLGPGQALTSFTHMRRPVIASIDPSPAKLRMTD